MGKHALDPQSPDVSRSNGFSTDPYPRLSQTDRRFLEELESLPLLGTLSVEEERARMQAGQATAVSEYPVKAQEYSTSVCPVYLVRPEGIQTPAPITFYLHGGGWVLGDLCTHTKLICELAVRTQSVVAFIDYPRAPEHQFPAPLEACITALHEVLQSAELLGLDRNRFVLGGDSSGGNLTAALIVSAIERKLPLPMCQILLYPAINHDWTTPSYKQFSTNPNLSQFTMEWFWDNYLPDKSLTSDPHVSPLHAGEEVFSQFPPTLIVTCEYDVLRDEGEQFAALLTRAGVDVTAVRWLGSLHSFLVTESLSSSVSAQTCIDMVAQHIRRAFEGI